MDKPTPIDITINGKTHQLTADNVEAMKQIPWSERKALIQLLEAIKQAEHVVKPKPESELPAVQRSMTRIKQATEQPPKLDPGVKKSAADVDDIMNQLLMQQPQKSSVPDKQVVYKWFLIIFVVVVLLSMIF